MDYQAKTVRLPEDLAERLRIAAFKLRVSQASLIVIALAAYLDQLEQGPARGGDAQDLR